MWSKWDSSLDLPDARTLFELAPGRVLLGPFGSEDLPFARSLEKGPVSDASEPDAEMSPWIHSVPSVSFTWRVMSRVLTLCPPLPICKH